MPVFIPLVNMSESFLVISVFCTKRVNFHHALNQNKFLITFVFTFLFQVFDDGDERTLRRTSLCLKGERHFNESEVCDLKTHYSSMFVSLLRPLINEIFHSI